MTRAADGDKQAWDALVERYVPLVWSICRRHQSDAADAGQVVWLQLAEHLDNIHDPAALADWLAATTRRECGPRPARGALSAGRRERDGLRDHPRRVHRHGRAGTGSSRAARDAARGIHPPAALLPAADRPANRRPARPARPDHRQARHPDRQHRAASPTLPGQATPRSGDRRPARRRRRSLLVWPAAARVVRLGDCRLRHLLQPAVWSSRGAG